MQSVNIYFNEGRVDADSIEYKDQGYTLTDITYIVPTGVDKDNLPETEDGVVYKITVLNSAILEVTEKKAYSYTTAQLPTDAEIVISVKGSAQVGYKVTEILDALDLKGYKEVTTVSLLDNDGIVYVQEDATKDAGLSVADVLEKMGAKDVKAINVICADDYSEQIDAADPDKVFLFRNEDKIDATSIAYPGEALAETVKIEILK